MNSFNEFLRKHGVDENIQASAEVVSFQNSNGKKFVYPLNDLERSLKAIWSAGNQLGELLENDWNYEETKFRNALGEILERQEWNAVASNLGNQTLNTILCLELFAYFKLQMTPSQDLRNAEILRSDLLTPIFKNMNTSDAFREWMKTSRELTEKSIDSYVRALEGILSEAAEKPLLDITSFHLLESLRLKILNNPRIIEVNTKGHSMYSAAFNNYSLFLKDRKHELAENFQEVGFTEIITEFNKALQRVGYCKPA